MLVSLKWLRDYVDVDLPLEEFTSRMIMSGMEVEDVKVMGEQLDRVVVGRIDKLSPHTNSDHLQICIIDVGEGEPVQIVTGAQNVFEGAYVPAALIGANLPCGMTIKKGKLRGEVSNGMLCSGGELCIDDSVYPGASVDGIMILREAYAPGTPIAKVLGMDDVIIDFKTTANRADCLSMIGMAREVAAALHTPMRMPAVSYTQVTDDTISRYLSVKVEEPSLCPRYMNRVVRNVKIEPSPAWMQQKLNAAGVRAINNIVDITNYVMLEMGQPMHAFDYREVEGREIIVRRAQAGEKLMTLDGKERVLTERMLVIANGNGPMGVAGVMGGENSGIHDDTQAVVFESATFSPLTIRQTSRALGMRTESSSRYEKGVDPTLAQLALDRAMGLIEQLHAGEIVEGAVDICSADLTPRVIRAKVARINSCMGITVEASQMKAILEDLLVPTEIDGDELVCTVPAWRGDLETYADLAEEVLRIYGYEHIPSRLMEGAMQGVRTPLQRANNDLKDQMVAMGFFEAVTYTFMSPSVFDRMLLEADSPLRNAIRLLNPLGEDYSLVRTFLVPAMLQSIANNTARKAADRVRLFEVSKIFVPADDTFTQQPDEIPTLCIGMLDDTADFFDLKGVLEALIRRFGLKGVSFSAGGPTYYHPGRKALATVKGKVLAELGEIHPDVQAAYELPGRTLVAQVNLRAFFEEADPAAAYRPLPKFPSVKRDLAVTVDASQPVGPMMDQIRQAGGSLLESVGVFDVYQGRQVGEGKKSVAFSLTYQAGDHTLVEEEINRVHQRILRALERSYQAEIRQ